MRSRIVTATVLTAAALAAVAACSSSSGTKSSAPTATSTQQADNAALQRSVTTYTADLFSGNAGGYKFLSERCKQQMTDKEWQTTATQAHQQYGSQTATGIHVDQLSGNLARVSYGAGNIPQFDRKSQPWVRESGAWRWDACPSSN